MTDKDKELCSQFLTQFKKLEKELLGIAKLRDDYVSFSRALNHIYYNRLNPIISQRDNYDFLRTASDVRNILSHETDVCVPTNDFINRFFKISQSIISPYTCYQVATKNIDTCHYSDYVFSICELMDEKDLSHIPVLNNEETVTGVFSRSSLFDYRQKFKHLNITDEFTIGDLREVLELNSHSNEVFIFVERNLNILSAFELIQKRKAHDKNVALLLVTEHGKKNEKLLGVITMVDLAKYNLDL